MADLPKLRGRTFALGVGAQKAGTTWLYEYLDDHPQVAMSPIKEMHFFGYRDCGPDDWPVKHFRKRLRDRRASDVKAGRTRPYGPLRQRIRMAGDFTEYRRFFRRTIGDAPVFGEITPAYCHLPRSEFEFIRDNFDDVRVIFLLRNPADRHWSQMRFSEGVETLEDLESRVDKTLAHRRYAERNNVAQTLEHLSAVFPREKLHFDFYERLFTPQAVARLCQFLGVDPHPANFDRAANVSVKMPLSLTLRAKIVSALRDQYFAVDDAFDGDLPDNWRQDMDRFL